LNTHLAGRDFLVSDDRRWFRNIQQLPAWQKAQPAPLD
jgi:hypothetical protein